MTVVEGLNYSYNIVENSERSRVGKEEGKSLSLWNWIKKFKDLKNKDNVTL